MEKITKDYKQIKKAKRQTKEQVLAQEIVDYFKDSSVTFYGVYFGVIKRMGYQATYESLKECQTRAGCNPQYWWGIVRAWKKDMVWLEGTNASVKAEELGIKV